jgi:uncharacterized protein (TIGR03086 family)
MSEPAPSIDIITAHDRALAKTGRVVAGIGAQPLDIPSRCTDWSVRDLLNHVVAGNLWVPELVGGKTIAEVGDRLDGDQLGSDPVAAYNKSASAASAAFAAPGGLDAPCAVSYGPVPGREYASHRFLDVLVHGWDLAVATGQDTTLDPELVAFCWAIAEPEAAMITGSGMFGTRISVPDDADAQTRLLGLLGRQA